MGGAFSREQARLTLDRGGEHGESAVAGGWDGHAVRPHVPGDRQYRHRFIAVGELRLVHRQAVEPVGARDGQRRTMTPY
jgi:hypothetical protein